MTKDFELQSLVAAARAEAACRARTAAREADRYRGVAWSGLGPDTIQEPSPEAVAVVRLDALHRWRASRPGRLLAALAEAQRAAAEIHAAADRARASVSRGLDAEAARCAAAVHALQSKAQALLAAARQAAAAMDAAAPGALTGGACATNTASSSPSTGSPTSSAS
ncbi:hypothetical protein DJ021_14070 [Phenylobacterium hankyongense]|uniref:Uncharacterized protein n=1 Tax=Phenylobacterium hankyongense TaxID=1813876 RepID=A0A328B2V8_9CAUL|nr:hypothetical protein [Phenylobacterium hankyongense]RAK60855.1 hypothetical protein DJ021_14070 [Phenylobacterium hankyongense]